MREGKSIFLGGCARLDYISGPPLYFAIFASSTLEFHCSNPESAEKLFHTKLGDFLTPPILLTPEQLKKENENAEKFTKKLYSYLKTEYPGKINAKEPANEIEPPNENENVDEAENNIIENEETQNDDNEFIPNEIIKKLNEQRPYPLPERFHEEVFELESGGEDFESAFVDFVFPGIGWISATGKSQDKLTFVLSSFSKPYIRDPIMPMEANKENRKARKYVKHGKITNYTKGEILINKE